MDISALMGYTGAVFQKFVGSWTGILLASMVLIIWLIIPIIGIERISSKKDF